eukprot:15044277-Alexandrium_andersonii.AAC.1
MVPNILYQSLRCNSCQPACAQSHARLLVHSPTLALAPTLTLALAPTANPAASPRADPETNLASTSAPTCMTFH